MEVDRRGRNPASLLTKMETVRATSGGHTVWVAVIALTASPETGAHLQVCGIRLLPYHTVILFL
jgi:hypothetical protein